MISGESVEEEPRRVVQRSWVSARCLLAQDEVWRWCCMEIVDGRRSWNAEADGIWIGLETGRGRVEAVGWFHSSFLVSDVRHLPPEAAASRLSDTLTLDPLVHEALGAWLSHALLVFLLSVLSVLSISRSPRILSLAAHALPVVER